MVEIDPKNGLLAACCRYPLNSNISYFRILKKKVWVGTDLYKTRLYPSLYFHRISTMHMWRQSSTPNILNLFVRIKSPKFVHSRIDMRSGYRSRSCSNLNLILSPCREEVLSSLASTTKIKWKKFSKISRGGLWHKVVQV